jgi:hypothetical protein
VEEVAATAHDESALESLADLYAAVVDVAGSSSGDIPAMKWVLQVQYCVVRALYTSIQHEGVAVEVLQAADGRLL